MAVGLTVPAVLIALTIAGGVAPGAVRARNHWESGLRRPAGGDLIVASDAPLPQLRRGRRDVGPDLSNGARNPDQAAIQAQIENGGGGMPPFRRRSPRQIQQIADFIAGLRTGTPPSS